MSVPGDAPKATVVVVTRNRREELREAVRSSLSQSVPVEVLVIDDGSTDGTADLVRTEFPGARVIRHAQSRGYIVRRNEGAAAAVGDVVFSIDDDAAFSTARVVEQTLSEFVGEGIGAVAIPYADVNHGPAIHQLAPDGVSVFVTDKYIGTAHAVRKDVFLRLGGYREHLFHQGEESDFCIRMLAAGSVVRLGRSDPIHHFESPKRDFRRMDHYGPRNAVLFAWQNVPLPYLLFHLPATVVGVLVWTLRPMRLSARIVGLFDGFRECFRQERRPVPARAYRLMRRLRSGAPPSRMSDVARELRVPTK